MTIRAVIFDYGMVLSHAQEPSALNNLLTITGLDRDTFDSHYWTHRHAYDMGKLNGPAYWRQFAADTSIELTATDIERLIENDVLMWCTINEPMLKWAKSLAEAGLKIGILSNMGHDTLAYMRQEFSWLGDFDHHTWSCELGIAKPDPKIMELQLKAQLDTQHQQAEAQRADLKTKSDIAIAERKFQLDAELQRQAAAQKAEEHQMNMAHSMVKAATQVKVKKTPDGTEQSGPDPQLLRDLMQHMRPQPKGMRVVRDAQGRVSHTEPVT